MPKAQRYVENSDFVADLLAGIKDEASVLSFAPKNTVRCTGRPLFRSQLARDVGCLLDIDVSVISWACLPMVLSRRSRRHVPDFAVTRATGVSLVDIAPASAKRAPPDWSSDAAHALGYDYELCHEAAVRSDARLENARDLLQYARCKASLGDRLRILTLLEEHGSMPLSTCLEAVRNGYDAIAVIAVFSTSAWYLFTPEIAAS
ncbi:hypothetical protein [Rhodopseudomonas sp. RCAM05734]|uniref:hypothetical protein n=1 Tax=Rhodopseudomonas sp. RCAM05734 TaxID=3457549 RepID=UPI004043F4F1